MSGFMEISASDSQYILTKMEEISVVVNCVLKNEYDENAKFEYKLHKDELEVTLVMDEKHEVVESELVKSRVLEILFDIPTLLIGTYIAHEEDFRVSSIEEGVELIRKKVYSVLHII